MSQCNRLTDLVSSAPERAAALSGELASHVEGCAHCQTEVQAATRLAELLAGHHNTLEPADDAVTRALSVVRSQSRSTSKSVRVWGPLAAAAALAGCVGLIVWWAHGRMTADPVEPSLNHAAPLAGRSSTPTAAGASDPRVGSPLVGSPLVALPKGSAVGLHVTGCPAENDARCRPGQTLVADTIVRSFTLSDQTTLTLNIGSQVLLSTDRKRGVEIVRGEVLIDVVKQAPLPPLEVRTEHGLVLVTGTQLQVTRAPNQTLVDVIRGRVEVDGLPLGAGQEAVLTSNRSPLIRAAPDLAEATRWMELDADEAEGSMGLGSLMARRPGAKDDSEEALRLTDHRVNVRIQGHLARTEIEEAFHNDTDTTLEGIYTFPMPSGARIAGLQLLVDGEWHEGAMVERERGEKIWRGVIRNAAPKHKKRDVVEYIWIPGPWRDPALLTWRGGSTFELRIFPIDARSERRVRIAYIEDLKRTAGGHRYVYPLAVPKDPSVRAERFEFNAHLSSDIDGAAVRTAPYPLEQKGGANTGETTLSTSARDFVPAGDLVID
ncbi:MAG: ferric-dicitrate binding protein FerR (iron transport regulator), partial [Myxococcota bacterium]